MEFELLDKLEAKIQKATWLIEELRTDNSKLNEEGIKVRTLREELNKLCGEKEFDINNHLQRETLIKVKIEEIINKLSILGPCKD